MHKDSTTSQTRLNLYSNENVIFIYDGAPVHHNPLDTGPNTELKGYRPTAHFSTSEENISTSEFKVCFDVFLECGVVEGIESIERAKLLVRKKRGRDHNLPFLYDVSHDMFTHR